MTTATLGQILDALVKLAASEGMDAPVVFLDHDTGWLQDVDPADFIDPTRTVDGEIILRSVGYHNKVGEPQGDVWTP